MLDMVHLDTHKIIWVMCLRFEQYFRITEQGLSHAKVTLIRTIEVLHDTWVVSALCQEVQWLSGRVLYS